MVIPDSATRTGNVGGVSHEPRTFTNDALGLRVTVVEDGSGTGGSLASAEISERLVARPLAMVGGRSS